MTRESGRKQKNLGSNQEFKLARHRFSQNKSDKIDKMSKPNIIFLMMDQFLTKWRYTWYPYNGKQLFNMLYDPDKQTNLTRDPARASLEIFQ